MVGDPPINEFMRVITEGQPYLNWRLTTVVHVGPVVAPE